MFCYSIGVRPADWTWRRGGGSEDLQLDYLLPSCWQTEGNRDNVCPLLLPTTEVLFGGIFSCLVIYILGYVHQHQVDVSFHQFLGFTCEIISPTGTCYAPSKDNKINLYSQDCHLNPHQIVMPLKGSIIFTVERVWLLIEEDYMFASTKSPVKSSAKMPPEGGMLFKEK